MATRPVFSSCRGMARPFGVPVLSAAEEPPVSSDDDKMDSFFAALNPPLPVASEAQTEEEEDDKVSALAPKIEDYFFEDTRLGVKASHELVETDDDGDPLTDRDRMIFVDEATCIGCTSCACIAPQTFQMEPEHGRARAVRQDGDLEEILEEAIATCPVDCIHWVPWDELVSLEKERETVIYNFKGRLVGNEGLASTNGAGAALLDISSNKASRCSNCPSNKCDNCPMFSVADDSARTALATSGTARKRCGNCPTNGCVGCPVASANPEFQKRRARREIKRKQRSKAQQDDIRKNLNLNKDQPIDL